MFPLQFSIWVTPFLFHLKLTVFSLQVLQQIDHALLFYVLRKLAFLFIFVSRNGSISQLFRAWWIKTIVSLLLLDGWEVEHKFMLVAFGGVSDRDLLFPNYQFSFRHFGRQKICVVFEVAKLYIMISHVSDRPFEFIFVGIVLALWRVLLLLFLARHLYRV